MLNTYTRDNLMVNLKGYVEKFPRRALRTLQHFKFASLANLIIGITILHPGTMAAQSLIAWNEPITITAESGRPLMDVLDRLQTIYRFPINYEDVPYEYASDIKNSLRQDGRVIGSFPVGGRLDVVLDGETKDVSSAVQRAVDAYRNAGFPGEYQVLQTASAIEVFPVAYRAADGRMKDFKALMSESVSIPNANRSIPEHMLALCNALSEAHGVKVECNPQLSHYETDVAFGANGMSGREAVSLLVNRLKDLSVRVLYEPGDKTYYVSLVNAFQPLPKIVAPTPIKPTLTHDPANPFFVKSPPK